MESGSVQQIDNWLDSRRDLEAGRFLLNSFASTYGLDKTTLSIINAYSNSGTADLIAEELEEIKSRILGSARPAPSAGAKTRFVDKKDEITLTPRLQELYENTKLWYDELHTTRGKSFALPEGDALRDACLQIIRLRKRIVQAYIELDYFSTYGEEMVVESELTRDEEIAKLTGWLRAQKINPAYISKNKNSVDPDVLKEVDRRKKEMQEINEYLANAD